MKIAITGGTGFVGAHLAMSLTDKGHNVVLIARGLDSRNETVRNLPGAEFAAIGTSNEESLYQAFQDCEAVAHCAGINREVNPGDYDRVHVQGTRNVINAAKRAGVKRLSLVSFFKARPNCGSVYHETKYEAEELVRNCGIEFTILKPGMLYGKGDHMLDHLSQVFRTLPVFATVGMKDRSVAPLAIEDLVRIIEVSVLENRLANKTIAVVGAEGVTLGDVARRVGKAVGKPPLVFPMPVVFHYGVAKLMEATMPMPIVATAQVQMLAEGFLEPYGDCDPLPDDLMPSTMFSEEQIRKGLPERKPLGLSDIGYGKSSR